MPHTDVNAEAAGLGETMADVAEYLTEVSFDDLPDQVIDRQRWHLLDTLGCILYGTSTPWVQKVLATLDAMEETGHGNASVPATQTTLPPARAALVNGTAAHSMDYDDYCRDAGVHAGSAVVPALLAYAETCDRPLGGEEAITATAAGVEAGVRAGLAIGRDSLHRGWHIAGWTGALAGAATAGKLLGLDAEKMGHALAIAGTQGSGLMGATYGAEVKRFHMGKAAESGYLAAALAERSFTGDTKMFTNRWGSIHTTMSDDHDVAALTADLGNRYIFLDKLTFKPFPSVAQTHPPVAALKEILERRHLETTDVASVLVRVTKTAADKAGRPFEPTGVMAAQSNIPYAVATYLLDGEVRLDAYTESAIRRPEIRKRSRDVEVVADESLRADAMDYSSRYRTVVELTTTDGQRYETEVSKPPGFSENPLSDEQLLGKFREQASVVLADANVDELADAVLHIDERSDIRHVLTGMH